MPSFFSRLALVAVAVASVAFGSPIAHQPELESRGGNFNGISLNRWGDFNSLDKFDDFFGVNNFDGRRNNQVFLIQQEQLVCNARQINQVQQQLAILQELAKKAILQQICEVEVQAIVLEQFRGGLDLFRRDLGRQNGRFPGFDFQVANKFNDVFDERGNFKDIDFGFNGRDIGRQIILPGGHNWDAIRSPESLIRAQDAAKGALDSALLELIL
ncbi:hypothetical protein FA15DRAFT_753676 [Coprinopsis marcescibilis]|uniref:Uncharacterized protein n=1 Tax=Coprinopsis marcescibilis TaxID=230819 RepID=A0A5C3L5N7_COPMA|nr:hypothetical protein FA15DRAFT_753676 [Coprinopsis marcescibilis]